MKVAFLCANFVPEARGGTERVLVGLGQALRRRGVEVAALSTSDLVHRGEDVRGEDCDGIAVTRVFKHLDEWDNRGLWRPRLLALARRWLQAERPDVVHAHSLSGFGGGQLQQVRELGMPAVLTFHDLWITCARFFRSPPDDITCPDGGGRDSCVPCVARDLPPAADAAIAAALGERDRQLRAEVAAATALTAPSRAAAQLVQRHLPTSRSIAVVPHGVLTATAAPSPPPAAGERLRVGMFGNLVEPKGVMLLVQAVAGLDCELHLSGPFLVPAFAEAVQRQARQQGTKLYCHGAFDAASAHPAARLHLAVFPSKCLETYGLVVDEALQHGVPVVVSDRGAFAERAQQGGVRVTGLDRLAATLRELLTDRDALAALRRAVPSVLPDIAAAAAAYDDLYRACLAGDPSS